ncbi:hypothetical protein, partial [Klebsiella quasipneumoniae]|uniref:hypothetical protein n=1 Tax=Klebsiella quasipneumoniae TaxID=1463165 RepID=UPI001C12C4B3
MTNLFRYCARLSAGWRLSPYPAYERQQYQTVMRLAVGPRKRSAAGQSLKITFSQGLHPLAVGEGRGEGKVNAKRQFFRLMTN